MALLHASGCMELKAWQPQVVEVDGQLRVGQGAVPQVVLSPRSKADRECFQTLLWTITYCSANDSFEESF
jgi:hypothetical protein